MQDSQIHYVYVIPRRRSMLYQVCMAVVLAFALAIGGLLLVFLWPGILICLDIFRGLYMT